LFMSDLLSDHEMLANKTLQATGAGRSDLDGEEDSLLPGFGAASLPAPVPELGR